MNAVSLFPCDYTPLKHQDTLHQQSMVTSYTTAIFNKTTLETSNILRTAKIHMMLTEKF